MHDCRKMNEDLIDLVFNEVDAEGELRILEEMERCAVCRREYRSMLDALSTFDKAATAALPAGEYWTDYRSSLDERLDKAAGGNVVPFWRRLSTSSFSIPAPAAIAAALVLAFTTALAVRSLAFPQTTTPAASAGQTQVQVVEKLVEKPVIVEKVVTRTVYVARPERTGAASAARRPQAPSIQDLQNMTARKSKNETGDSSRATLNGFQPPSEVKLTVIKGSYPDEK